MGKYFIDTEFDGFNGELMSIALVPENRNHPNFYAVTQHRATDPWVIEHVEPYLGVHMFTKDVGHITTRQTRKGIAQLLCGYLITDRCPTIVADWPEDLSHFMRLLITGPGKMLPLRHIRFEYIDFPNFSTAKSSKVPHNALEDAIAFRDYMISKEDW